MSNPLKLKKYSNRRLYDTEKSAYVTLHEVAEMIKSGRSVEVVDVKTNEDVTAFILTQIILEEAKNRNAFLPIPFLHLIIQYGNILGEFFEKYLLKTLQIYLTQKEALDSQLMRWLEMGTDFTQLARKTSESLKPFQSLMKGLSNPEKAESDPSGDTR